MGRRGAVCSRSACSISSKGMQGATRQRQTVVKNLVARPPSSSCYLPRAEAPLTTIYREERRCVINSSSARGRNFKNFSVFPLLPLPRARSPLCRVLSRPWRGAALRRREREGLLRGFAEWLIYQINPAANFQLIISALTHRENVT